MEKKVEPASRKGKVIVPASKSDVQRAYLAAALAEGTSVISGTGTSDDERAMLTAIQMLGARVTHSETEAVIEGMAHFPETAIISAGESGLGIRLLGMVCAAHPGYFTITGTGSLVTRPMDFFEEVVPKFGGSCSTDKGTLPLRFQQPMKGAEVEVDGSLSSQFISGLLMALPLAEGDSLLHVNELKSSPYVEMTLQTLEAFGITISYTGLDRFEIKGNQKYKAANYAVDADWSSASYWLIASAIGHPVSVHGLKMNSLQADKNLLNFLMAANCKVNRSENGITIDGSQRQSFSVDATNCPDLFPALVTLAAFCNGESVIKGVLRLMHKESDRSLTLQSEFGKLGVRIALTEDTMTIHGNGKLKGGNVSSHHDHRIAMALAIAGLSAETAVIIEDAEAVSKSYPEFWDVLEGLEADASASEKLQDFF